MCQGNCGYGMDLSKYPLLNHRLDFVRVYLSCLDKDHVAGVLATLNLDISVLENEEFIWGFQVRKFSPYHAPNLKCRDGPGNLSYFCACLSFALGFLGTDAVQTLQSC